jgi:hypothetical protein
MTTSRVLAAAALLGLAVAGCSSSSDSDTPDPGALASSIKAQATSPAAAPSSADSSSGADSSGDCGSAPLSAKAALAGMSITDVSMVEGCTNIYIKTPTTDPAIGKDICDKVAGEVYQMGVKTIAVESDSGAALAVGSPATGCLTP